MTHTKGPWILQKAGDGYRIITNGKYTMNLDGPLYPSPAQAEAFEAHARLIAAAPELLEELAEALYIIHVMEAKLTAAWSKQSDATKQIWRDKAIRKAKGEGNEPNHEI